jgi:membrane carboxypeptidase/penicillin-binding protein PbpC
MTFSVSFLSRMRDAVRAAMDDRWLQVAGIPVAAFVALSLLFPLPEPKPYSQVLLDRNGRILQAFLATDG